MFSHWRDFFALGPVDSARNLTTGGNGMMHRWTKRLIWAVAFFAGTLSAQTGGKGYVEITGAPKPAGSIEVIEFFTYACPHCAAFRAEVDAWRSRLPSNAVYRRVAIAFNQASVPHAQMYYALEALGRVNDLHPKVFEAVHNLRVPLHKPEDQADFFAKSGIDRKRYLDAYNSFGVQAKVKEGMQMAKTYRLDNVPALAINGRYVTGPAMTGGNAETVRIASQLLSGNTAVRQGAPADDRPSAGGGASN